MPIDDDHQGFLKECQIFNIKSGGVTPGQVTMQLAYDGDPLVNMAAASPVVFNTSVGTQALIIDDKGTQSHLPIYQLQTLSLNLSADLIDSIFQNDQSEEDNTIVIQEAIVYSQNASFQTLAFTHPITVQAEVGVTLDNTDGGSRLILPGQGWQFLQITDKVWTSINVQPTAGEGIIFEDGVISSDGSGTSVGYGYVSGVSGSFIGPMSFSDQGTYYIPLVGNDTTYVSRGVNLVPYLDGNSTIGLKNTGPSGMFYIIVKILVGYTPSNTNPAANEYMISGNINKAPGPGGSFAPIDLILSPYSSQSDKKFTVLPNYQTTVTFPLLVQLNENDTFYPVIRNAGPSNSNPLNEIYIFEYSYTGLRAGAVGGTSAGVESLNGLLGVLGLICPDGSIIFSSSGSNITARTNLVGADFDPTLTNVQGASASAVVSGIYNSKTNSCKMTIEATTDTSDDLVKINFPFPVAMTAIEGCVVGVIKTSLLDTAGATGSGSGRPLILIDPMTAQLVFEGSEQSTQYTVNLAFDFIPS